MQCENKSAEMDVNTFESCRLCLLVDFLLYQELIPQASTHSQVSIFCDQTYSRILPEEVTLSFFLPRFPFHSLSSPYLFLSQPLFISLSFSVFPISFDSLSLSFHLLHPTLPPSLFLYLTSSLH